MGLSSPFNVTRAVGVNGETTACPSMRGGLLHGSHVVSSAYDPRPGEHRRSVSSGQDPDHLTITESSLQNQVACVATAPSCWSQGEGAGVTRDQAEIEQKYRQCLESFVVRARRVAEHSLADDWEKLVALIEPQIGVSFEKGEVRIRHELPAEEVVESAAARIRPILLETEDCFYMKALKALSYACRELPQDAERVRAVRAEWKTRVAPATPAEAAYRVLVANMATGEEHDLDAHQLALAWIYGDVVHHDAERRKDGDPFGLRDRFRAAVPLVAWTMVATIELLAYTEALWKDGVLQLRPAVFDGQVALKSTIWEERAQMFFAPVGTEPPSSASAPIPRDWIPLRREMDLSAFKNIFGGQLLHPTTSGRTTTPSREDSRAGQRNGEDNGARIVQVIPRQPRRPVKDWQAELIERWRATQP
ncbi:hypothetical protein [Streptomyces sp. NPDC003435]